jgi:hypothetical protein
MSENKISMLIESLRVARDTGDSEPGAELSTVSLNR